MHFSNVLAVSASLIALGYAADPLAFTSWPKEVAAGKPVTLTWAGATANQPVTLTLRKGSAGDLSDVETITDQAKDGTFTWTPGDNIKEGESYAFQVSQGGQKNYSALLKAVAGQPKAETVSDATQTTDMTTGATTEATAASTTTDATATGAQTTSKPLISSSASGTPSGSPSSTVVSSTVTAAGPMMTNTDVVNGKEASATASMQNVGSVSSFSRELVMGVLGLCVYLVQ